jgi:acyl carrier protein
MTPENIQDRIKDIIVSSVDIKINKDDIAAGENGLNHLGLNSLNMIKMLVEIEKEFDIEIDFDEINPETWYSLDNLSNYILSLKQIINHE